VYSEVVEEDGTSCGGKVTAEVKRVPPRRAYSVA
jgi:hypothetical protein